MTQELKDDCILSEWGNEMAKAGNPEYMSEKKFLAEIAGDLDSILAILKEIYFLLEANSVKQGAGDEIEADEALKPFIKRYKHK